MKSHIAVSRNTEPIHTTNHIDCPACRVFQVRATEPAAIANLTFHEAAPLWLEGHKAAIAKKTIFDYEFYIRTLDRFFGELPSRSIHIGHLHAYAAGSVRQRWERAALIMS